MEIETTVTAKPVEEFTVTTSIIDQKETQKTPVRNLGELLRSQNGVFSLGIANKKGKADLGIRGFGMNYIRVFIDGVPLNNANDRTVDLSLIPIEYIERIEVIKGAAPVTYGSDSMGGIINIITKSGKDNPGVFIKASGGDFGSLEASITAGGSQGDLGYFLMVKNRKTDGYRPHTAESFTDIFIKGDYSFSPHTSLAMLFFNTAGNREAPDGVNLDGSLRRQQTGFWAGSYQWKYNDIVQQGINLKLEKNNPKETGYRLNLYYGKYEDTLSSFVDPLTEIRPPAGSPFAYYRTGSRNYSYWNSLIKGGDARLIIPAGNHKITVGAGVETNSFRDTYLGRKKETDPAGSMSRPKEEWDRNYWTPWTDLSYSSIYLQDEIKLNPSLTLTLGCRSDSFAKSPSSLNGIANLVYVQGNDTWRVSAAKTGRFPSLKELEGPGGNPNLLPESAWNYELGYRHRKPSLFDVEASIYYSSINNLIQPVNPSEGFSIKENVSRVDILGGEAGISRAWGDLEGKIGYSYVNRVSPPLTPDWEEVPKHKASASLRWSRENSLCWAVEGIAMGSKKTGDPNADYLPGYGIVNAMAAYPSFLQGNKKDSSWNLELKITNLFDKKYQDRLYFPAPGRWTTGSINYRF